MKEANWGQICLSPSLSSYRSCIFCLLILTPEPCELWSIYVVETIYLHFAAASLCLHHSCSRAPTCSCFFSLTLSFAWTVGLISVCLSSVAALMIGGTIWDVQRWMRVFALAIIPSARAKQHEQLKAHLDQSNCASGRQDQCHWISTCCVLYIRAKVIRDCVTLWGDEFDPFVISVFLHVWWARTCHRCCI